MRINKAISPILATVILIAVTLVIAIGVIGWIMGIWGTFGAVETIQILADSKLYSNGTIKLHVRNTGSVPAVIYKVEIVGVGSTTEINATTEVTLTPGEMKTLTATITEDTITPGASYLIKVYTKAGNMYPITLTAEAGT